MGGVTVCAEANTAAGETVHELKCGIVSGFPCPPNTQGCLANIDVTRAIGSVSIATVDARSTDEAIQALFDCFHRIHRFDQNPDLDHVARFSVVGRGGEAGGDDHPLGIFVKDVAVQRAPPTRSSATQ